MWFSLPILILHSAFYDEYLCKNLFSAFFNGSKRWLISLPLKNYQSLFHRSKFLGKKHWSKMMLDFWAADKILQSLQGTDN